MKNLPIPAFYYLSRVPFYLKVNILEYAGLKIFSCKRFLLQKFVAVKSLAPKIFRAKIFWDKVSRLMPRIPSFKTKKMHQILTKVS